jgi:YD repeat-containing protein
MTKQIRPDGTEILYEYDGSGELIRQTAVGKTILTQDYNEIGKLVTMLGGDERTEYQYNQAGLLITAKNKEG